MPSTPRSKGSGRGSEGAPRAPVTVPMSERQQLALLMQISSQESGPAVPTPAAEERKKSRQQRNGRGETPLHVASIRGDRDQVKKLLDQGQDPNIPDFAGWTALHEACSYGWFEVVELLVNGGANVNAKGLDDDTPLHDATTSGNLSMVKFLVEHGADPFVKNTKGKMPSDYAAPPIFEYLEYLKDSNAKATHASRASNDSGKKANASASTDCKRNMDALTAGEPYDPNGKDPIAPEKEGGQVSSGVVSSSQDDVGHKRPYPEGNPESDPLEDDLAKRRKKDDKEVMGKPAPPRGGSGRKQPGPASKTGATPLPKGSQTGNRSGKVSSQGKGSKDKSSSTGSHSSKSSERSKSLTSKTDRKSPVASPKPAATKETDDDEKPQESAAPKVPPLKIVIPGGAGASGRTEQEGEGQRGGGKGRSSAATLPYVIPCTADSGQTSDSSDGNDDKRGGDGKTGQRVLRSHKNVDDKDKERTSPHVNALGVNKSPQPAGQDGDHVSTSKNEPAPPAPSVELHPRKRKIKPSKEHREPKGDHHESSAHAAAAHSNPYQMYIHIRKQIDRRQKLLFPVKPKPPKDFNKYLMNRCTYTLQGNVNPEPTVEIPPNLPAQMASEFVLQEKERTRLRIQHLVEKEKLVLAVEQEILRVHGRAERAVANQSLPFSVCTMLRDNEVYNVLAPEQEEKRNAQRSRCNGRQINSWLQEVDDKWEKIKEGMLQRQHTEAQTLHAVQTMGWEWKLKELGICDYKTSPKIDTKHVPQLHVSNFDLPA